ncbi:238_t:CDS:2, partial [Racocetra fulgida]
KHEQLIQNANIMRSTVYNLPEEAIEETHKMLVYHIKERLKQHSKYAGNIRIMGVDSYFILSQILRDDNWGTKYFLQHQKTFVLLYQLSSSLNESDPLQESNSIQESNSQQESNSFQESNPL